MGCSQANLWSWLQKRGKKQRMSRRRAAGAEATEGSPTGGSPGLGAGEGWEKGGVHFGEGKVGKEEMSVGGCWCLLIKCKLKADGTQTDMSNFCVCSWGGVWKGTGVLGEMLLENVLSTQGRTHD